MDSLLRRRVFGALVPFVVFLTGCGGSGRLDGKITLDGQPLEGGNITLVPAQGPKVSCEITAGTYSFDSSRHLAPGKYGVQINWLKKTGKKIPNPSDPGTTVEESQQQIPMKYNSKTELSIEIESGSNTKDFELKSGAPISQPAGVSGSANDTAKPGGKAAGGDPDQSRPGRN